MHCQNMLVMVLCVSAELVTYAVAYYNCVTFSLQAGVGLDVNTEREIVNHRKLLHPNIIR